MGPTEKILAQKIGTPIDGGRPDVWKAGGDLFFVAPHPPPPATAKGTGCHRGVALAYPAPQGVELRLHNLTPA